jgi:ABC-2 type transport system permease protein
MTRRGFAWFMAAVIVAVFLSANALTGVWLRGARLDLTADRLYTLSPGTRQVLARLNEPVDLSFFYSAEVGARYPVVAAYAARVRELLQAYAGRARGQIRLQEIDPVRFSESEDAANASGIAPVTAQAGAEPLYFGLAGANAADERAAIAAFSPAREPFLEYDVTRLIAQLEAPSQASIAVISTLPLTGPNGGLLFFNELARGARIDILPRDFTAIPETTSVLALLQPWALDEAQLYAVDQFIMRKGRALIAADPAAVTWDGAGVEPASDVSALLAAWGVSMPSGVLADGQNALAVRSSDAFGRVIEAPQPLYFKAPAAQMARDDLTTAALTRQINFAAPGSLNVTLVDGVTVTPLIHTSRQTMRISSASALARPTPREVAQSFRPSGRAETLALRLSGILPSAFGAAPPVGKANHVAKSARPAEIVVIADSDFLNDAFYVSDARAPFADNGAFVLNAIDLLAGDDALVSLRSRAPSARPLTMIDRMREEASTRLAATQTRLRKEIEDTEARLGELERRSGNGGYFPGALGAERSAAERAEAERFRARAVQLRGELRATERDFRRGLDVLQGWVMFINIWLAPLLIAAGGAFMLWRRQARAERRR